MENENKLKKGTFEKISENLYKINGNEVPFTNEGDMDLIPIVRDIVEQGKDVVLENYNSGKSSYSIDGENVPIAEIVTEITDFLDSLPIHQKTIKKKYCYYKLGDKELSVEKELIPLVEDISNKKDISISQYKFQKESYLINNKSVPVNDVIFEIRSMFACWLEAWKVNECHYKIKGEEFHIKDDDVQIINKLINGIDESNVPKYEQKKCVYDISGNECLIANLSSYLVFLLYDKPNFDDKVAAEIKEIYLKDKIDLNKKELAKKAHCFISTLPKPIFIAIRKAEKEYNEDSIFQLRKDLKSDTNSRFQHIAPKDFVDIQKQMMSYYDGFLELIFEEIDEEEARLLYQKLESEDIENIYTFIGEEIKNQRLKVRNGINLEDMYDALINNTQSPQYEPISEFCLYFIQAVVTVYHEEYEEWKNKAEVEGIINLDLTSEFYFREGYKNEVFLFYYAFFEGQFFNQLFHAMNYGFIKPEVMKKYIIDRLQELELAEYVQKRYDEYRKVTGGGKDFCFCDITELSLTSRLPMPDGFDNKKLVKLHQAFYSYVDAGQPLCFFLGSSTSNTDTKTVLWNGDRHTLQVFIKELYGKDAKGKPKSKTPNNIWKIACNIFLPKGEKLSENTLKTGEIQLAEEIRLEIAENIQKIRILKWKDTN